MRGEWYTTDSGGGIRAPLLAGGALLLAASGGAAAAAIATAVIVVLIVIGTLVVLAVAGGVALLAYRVRHGSPAGQGIVRAPIVHELPGPERPALEAPAARELHLHFHGTSPEQVAEILRSHELPDEYRRGT
jgi:hypothetical protein